MTDQQTADAMSCAGNSNLETPAMDSIAVSGMRFERAYVTQPLCAPCRSSMQTGRYPHEIGMTHNKKDFNGDYPMLGKLMAGGGYECAYFGKWHVGVPFDFDNAGYQIAEDTDVDAVNADKAIEFLRDTARNKPFFLTVSLKNPHDVCQLARGEDLPQGPNPPTPADPTILPPLPPNFEIQENEPDVIRQVQEINRDYHYPTAEWDQIKWRQYLWGYYRLVEKVDKEIGRVLEALREMGQEEDTVIIFLSDHGEGVSSHHWNQKQILYEEAVNVPFLISWKGMTEAGQVSKALVSTGIDLMPTILDYAGVTPPTSLSGESLKDISKGGAPRWDRRYVVAETSFAKGANDTGVLGRMLRSDRYKYIVYNQGTLREQLFDLEEDPNEIVNLVMDASLKQVLSEHRSLLTEWAASTMDDFPYVDPGPEDI
jgi:arylsulfatase A-like enzyme